MSKIYSFYEAPVKVPEFDNHYSYRCKICTVKDLIIIKGYTTNLWKHMKIETHKSHIESLESSPIQINQQKDEDFSIVLKVFQLWAPTIRLLLILIECLF
jgi:hypothetical protein